MDHGSRVHMSMCVAVDGREVWPGRLFGGSLDCVYCVRSSDGSERGACAKIALLEVVEGAATTAMGGGLGAGRPST